MDEIKATPGRVAESIEKKVEETVKDIEEGVEELISLPGKKIDEVSAVWNFWIGFVCVKALLESSCYFCS